MTDKYTIAIDARRLRGTTGRYVRELLNNLQKIDLENTYHIIVHTKDEGTWKPSQDNFKLHVVPWDHYTLGEQTSFNRFLSQLMPDLVHFTMPQQPLLYSGKKVTTVHDLTLVKFKNPNENPIIYPVKQSIFKFLLKRVIKTSQTIYTLAEYTKAQIADYGKVAPSKVLIAHPAADAMSSKQKAYKDAADKEYIVYVGNTFPYKNVARLIEAHQLLLARRPELHLFVVGKIDDNVEVLRKSVAANLHQNVHFTGFVDDEELAWLYAHAQAYVFPSLSEGFGMPSLEAMYFDIPVVSSDATVLPEINGDAAHYFDPEDVDEMAKSIEEVLSDAKLRQKLVANGQKQRGKYSWMDMAQIIHRDYLDKLRN